MVLYANAQGGGGGPPGAAKARAALKKQTFETPDDVREVARSVLNHRLMLTAEAEVEGMTADAVISTGLERVAVPR